MDTMIHKLTLIFLIFWLPLKCYPEAGKLFTADVQLSNSLINHVYQDRNGFVWVATEDGLNRFDGSKVTTFKQENNNPGSLLNNYVRILLEDHKGNFFIGFFNGLQLYDYATNQFVKIPLVLETGDSFRAHVTTLIERKNGEILVGTSGHGVFLVILDEDKPIAKQLSHFVPSNFINFLFEDKNEDLWISTDKGLFKYGRDESLNNYLKNKETSLGSISSICEDNEGNIFVGSLTKGLFRYDKGTDSFIKIPYPENPNLPVKTLYLSRTNDIYIGTDGNGMKKYSLSQNEITEGNFNLSKFDFSKSKIHSILEDRAGNLWLGIFQKGVLLIPFHLEAFNYIGYKSFTKNIIGSNSVTALFHDHEETLWVGTDSDGIYGIDPRGKKNIHYSNSSSKGSVPSTIMCIYEDSNNDLWIGSFLNGLGKFDRKTGKYEQINLIDKDSNYVQRVYSLVEDKNKNLWIGTMGAGLFYLELGTNNIITFPNEEDGHPQGEKGILHNKWINCLLLTRNEKLYIGTYDGLSCLDLKSRSFVSTYNTSRLLSGTIIYSLFEDSKGTVWLGTSEGIKYIGEETHEIFSYTEDDGLPSNVIYGIQEDNEGNLWISTNYGLSRFTASTSKFKNYYANDGLQGNEFSRGANLINKNGQIMFGGISGITLFNPNEIMDHEKELKVKIIDFYIHDKPVTKGMKSGSYEIMDKSILEANTIHLSHLDNSFSIEFSVLEFNSPERVSYMYANNDNNWIKLSPGNNRVAFNNLAPGKYHFKVKAQDYHTTSSEKEITIYIHPAWYFSDWAKLIYLILFLVIIFIIVQQARQRILSRKELQAHIHAEQINEAKLQFFINISHEIKTPVSLIINPLKRLINIDSDPDRQKAYLTMHRNSERILQLAKQLMDIRKIDKGQMKLKFQEINVINFIKNLLQMFDDQVHTKKIKLEFYPIVEELYVWVDPRHFDKIILNLISNALKFTPVEGEIKLYLRTVSNHDVHKPFKEFVEIIVVDSGVGIEESEMEKIFDRFYQAQNNTSNSYEGTGIGLHLTRSLVELHYGSIRAENNTEGSGCRFILHIPLGNNHLNPEQIDNSATYFEQEMKAKPITLPAEIDKVNVKSKSKSRLLIVDDNPEIRAYISQELASDFHIVESSNGKEALAMILQKAPDLIISDVMMPEMDGITLCRKIKQNVNVNHVPIILLTARTEEKYNIEGLDIGADAYLPKPFNIEILKKTATNIIKNRELLRNSFTGNQLQKDKIKKISIKSADDRLMKKVMEIINNNISNPQLNVETLAKDIGISRVHLHRKLKELTNQSTRDLIRNVRLQQAANLLSSKNINISEVAYAVGFTNVGHFSTAFKELYGTSPTTFMENSTIGQVNYEDETVFPKHRS